MAFANLFTRLSVVEEDVKSPGKPAFTHRNETDNGKRGNGRKRKTQGEQAGSYKKKRCYQAQTTRTYNATSFKDDDSEAIHCHMQNTDSEHASDGFTKEVKHNHRNKAGYNNMCHKGQNCKTKNNRNVNKQQQQKKETERQKNQHQQKDRCRPANRGGSHQTRPTRNSGWGSKNKNDKQDFQVKRTRFMTQEFKDQNALLVDGRLLCRHFIWGRCIKGDDCQLEHIQGYNNLVKEVCKFYVQGLCTKGESCPYMHKSFPCKFFHRKGKCSQGADCRFSHEPLNDVTNQLLDEALKRENDLYELAKKAEQESSGQPANTDESEIINANTTPDILIQPLRPNFYKSTDTNAEEALCQTEELADIMEGAVPSHASNAVQPHGTPSTNLNHEEPVCYSVEAVLGPQLSKPFPSFFTTPGSQESAPLSSSDCTPGSAYQSEVPYSVDAVLRSCKSVGNSTVGHTCTPPTAQTVSYTPKSYFEENTDPLLNSETQNEKVLYSVNTRNENNKSQTTKMFKSQLSLQMHTGWISKTCPNLTLSSGDHIKQGGNMPESLKPAQRGSHEVKLGLLHSPVTVAEKSASSKSKGDMKGSTHLPTDISCSINCKSDGVLPFGLSKRKSICSRPPSQTSSKHPTQLKPHLSLLTSDSQTSIKPFCPSSGFTEFKGRAIVPVEPATSSIKTSDFTNSVSQPIEIHLHSKKTQSGHKLGTKQHYSTETTADYSRKMAHCGDLAVGCKKTVKRPFHSLFASPIADTLQPLDDSVTSSSCPQGLIQSSCPAPQSSDCRSTDVKTVLEPDKTSARSVLSLFAAPLSAAPLPCMQSQPDYSRTSSCSQQSNQSVDNTSHLSDSKQRASNLETPLPHQALTDVKEISHVPRSPNFFPNPEIGNEDSSTEHINQPTKQLVNPVCSLVSNSLSERSTSPTPCGNSPSTTHAYQTLPDISSHKVAATANSVLKTLFLCLSPYQQDGEHQDSIQIIVPSESEKQDKSSTGCVFVKQQRKGKKKGSRKKKLKTQDSHKKSTEKTVAHSTEHQLMLQTHQISLEATGGSTLSSPGMTESQVRNSGTHNLPFKPVVPLMQHHTRPRLKHTSEEGKWVNGNVAATPLKDLFKTLDTTVFHFGH
ncbi:uncharacterized protein LOC122872829 isoform X2 [Siniperca chuatsi]|uniref:uncharacterized protein LOC122872829 isoform X2 n=1 Tax=Siniperca chuatsi TaxID=119488 RepID=UPI001CE04090|nr:uncharacterized protein LOC122872829 isoform X2 [Siniperca chuatsi]